MINIKIVSFGENYRIAYISVYQSEYAPESWSLAISFVGRFSLSLVPSKAGVVTKSKPGRKNKQWKNVRNDFGYRLNESERSSIRVHRFMAANTGTERTAQSETSRDRLSAREMRQIFCQHYIPWGTEREKNY